MGGRGQDEVQGVRVDTWVSSGTEVHRRTTHRACTMVDVASLQAGQLALAMAAWVRTHPNLPYH